VLRISCLFTFSRFHVFTFHVFTFHVFTFSRFTFHVFPFSRFHVSRFPVFPSSRTMPEPHFSSLYEARIMAAIGATLKSEWIYLDYDSREAFRVLAYETGGAGAVRKIIRTLWPVAPWEDRWRMDEPPGPWPLYRLPELPHFGRVYVCQSESAADAMRWAGLAATTSAHGCYAVHKTDWAPLAGTDVVIVPDNNQSGPIYARTAAAALDRLMPSAFDMRVLELPGLPVNGDILYFLTAPRPGSTQSMAERIEALADRASHWSEYCSREFPATPSRPADEAHRVTERSPETVPRAPIPVSGTASPHAGPSGAGSEPALSETQPELHDQHPASVPETLDWLWPAHLALGELNLLLLSPADPLLALDLAARVSTGAPWPDDTGRAPRGSVVLVNFPDALPDITSRLLDKAGADMTRIVAAAAARRTTPDSPHVPAIAAIRQAIQQIGDVRLVLIDRASDYLGRHPRAALAALTALAAERQLAIVLLHRLPPNPGGPTRLRVRAGRPLEMARSTWLAIPDPQDPARRLLLPLTTAPQHPGLAYRVIDGTLAWAPVPSPPSARAVLRAQGKKPGPRSAAQRAAARWLRRRLSLGPAHAGHVRRPDAKSLRQEADEAGHSWTTIRRALRDMGAVKERCAVSGKCAWRVS
jgi:hypothetical protein